MASQRLACCASGQRRRRRKTNGETVSLDFPRPTAFGSCQRLAKSQDRSAKAAARTCCAGRKCSPVSAIEPPSVGAYLISQPASKRRLLVSVNNFGFLFQLFSAGQRNLIRKPNSGHSTGPPPPPQARASGHTSCLHASKQVHELTWLGFVCNTAITTWPGELTTTVVSQPVSQSAGWLPG